MQFIFSFIAAAAVVYSLLIFIRIIISWLGGAVTGKPVNFLTRVTDPYLDWWRRTLNLRLGFLDLSPVAAIAALSLVQSIFGTLSRFDRITIGNILAIVLMSFWSVVSFLLGFCLLIIILRLIAYITNRNVYASFWQAIDTISQPLLYRINRIIFGRRIPGYLKGIITSLFLLAAIWIGGKYAMPRLARLLFRLPF